MNDIESLWHNETYPWFDGHYNTLVEDFGEIVLEADFGYYQGDYIYIFKSGWGYGFLIVGYGSCSGCDMLQSCESLDSVLELQESLRNGVKWFDNLDDLKTYILDDNRDLEWYSHEAGWNEFVNNVKEL